MKLSILKKTTVLLSSAAIMGLSGCGTTGTPTDKGATGSADLTGAQAKDAMALNAFIYPIVAPLTNVSDCLQSPSNVLQCLKDSIPVTETVLQDSQPLTPGDYECTPGTPGNGTYTYSEPTLDSVKFIFNAGCADYGNSQNLQARLVVGSCFLGLPPIPDSGTPQPDGTYRIEYTGSVECTSTKKTATGYSYRTIGNTNAQTKSEWSYNGTLDFGANPILVDGNIRGIAKYAVGTDDPSTPWVDLFLGSDEEWVFDAVKLTLGSTLTFDGKGTYIKHPNDNNNGDGDFFIEFASLAYAMTHNGRDIIADISGTVSATCQPTPVTYATTVSMDDVNTIRDANGYRMPSTGSMTMTLPGKNPATAVFSTGSSAQVAITAGEDTQTYTTWKDVVGTSSCSGMQDWMDNIIQPKPPVSAPIAGKIIPENVLFDDAASFVLAPDEFSASGKTDGRAVWYHLKNGQGYTDGQTVGDTNFQFSLSVSPATVTPFVNVYLLDEQNVNQRVSIYSSEDWNNLQRSNPNWIIRTDYIESDLPTGTLYQGNFILRIGDSTYDGSGEDFTISKYLLELAPK